jgi:hypothetical protein
MRRLFILGLVGTLLAATSIAVAGGTRWAWTEPKARQTVVRQASVKLQDTLKSSLASELQEAVRLYGALVFAAQQVGDSHLGVYQSLLARYRSAREKVRSGVPIDAAACKGSGVATEGKRYSRFRCGVTSDLLEIPSAELEYGDAEFPTVVEGPSRIEGPYKAQLAVRVIGRSAISYQQLGHLESHRLAARSHSWRR